MNTLFHIKLALRKLKNNSRATLLLMLSFVVGLSSFIIVSSYISYERNYDKHFPDAENIYRITTDIYSNGELKLSEPKCERMVGEKLVSDYPDVLRSGYLVETFNPQYRIDDHIFSNNQVFHASPGLIDVFSISLVEGNKEDVLKSPYTVLISEAMAKKYFGDINPVGKILYKYPGHEYTIEGVYKGIPDQTHFKADMLLSFHDQMILPPPLLNPWGETGYHTYIKTKSHIDKTDLEQKINALVVANKKSFFDKTNSSHTYHLQPLNSIHLHSHLNHELGVNPRADYLNILLLVSLLVMLAVGFNYIHYSYTQVIEQAKNNGIQKIVGANRRLFIVQAITESSIVHILGFVIAFSFCLVLEPLLENKFNTSIDLSFQNTSFWAGLVGILIISTIINGLIPGIFVNKLEILQLFNLKKQPLQKGFSVRQGIVITQFAIIIAIVISIIGIDKQINFLKEKDKGFSSERVLALKIPSNLRRNSGRINNLDAFEQQVKEHASVKDITQSNTIPGEFQASNFTFKEKGNDKKGKAITLVTSANYLEMLNIKLLAGKGFLSSSSNNGLCVISENCAKQLGYIKSEEAIGRQLQLNDESMMQNFEVEIAGVCADFNLEGIRKKPESLILLDWTANMIFGNYMVKLNTNNFAEVLPFIKEKFEATFPNYPFEYVIVEDFYNKLLDKENQLLTMLGIFVLIAILVSAVNLIAMAWFISLARTKEIGIRKVNGAKMGEVIYLLNKNFMGWIGIAFLIACPVASFFVQRWLNGFAYKTNLSWWIYVLSGLLAMGIALLTVSWQSWRAARRNPVEALRYE